MNWDIDKFSGGHTVASASSLNSWSTSNPIAFADLIKMIGKVPVLNVNSPTYAQPKGWVHYPTIYRDKAPTDRLDKLKECPNVWLEVAGRNAAIKWARAGNKMWVNSSGKYSNVEYSNDVIIDPTDEEITWIVAGVLKDDKHFLKPEIPNADFPEMTHNAMNKSLMSRSVGRVSSFTVS